MNQLYYVLSSQSSIIDGNWVVDFLILNLIPVHIVVISKYMLAYGLFNIFGPFTFQ